VPQKNGKKLDLNKLYTSLLESRLEECVKGTCECITQAEHQRNLERARKLAMTSKREKGGIYA
jgi:hypothetical protein